MDSNVVRELNRRYRGCLIDTRDLIALAKIRDFQRRCEYVQVAVAQLGYPWVSLPWEPIINRELIPQLEQNDLEMIFSQLRIGLSELGYNGEELIVSPSKGSWVIVSYIGSVKHDH